MPGVLAAVAFALVDFGGLECKVLNYIFLLDKSGSLCMFTIVVALNLLCLFAAVLPSYPHCHPFSS